MKRAISFIYSMRAQAQGVYDIDVGGTISENKWEDSDVTAKDFAEMLKKASGADRLNVHINSPGGSVNQAVAMRQMLINADVKEKHVYIDGLCASAATLLACINAPVHMAKGAMYMIHNPSTISWGDYRQMQHDADLLKKMAGEFADIYAAESKQEVEIVRQWMDDETWFTADEAIQNGFVDDVTGIEAVACANINDLSGIYARVPDTMPSLPRQPTIAAVAENTIEQGENTMEWTDITMEAFKSECSELYAQMVDAAKAEERARIQAIDEAAGISDEMANNAKYVEMCDAGQYALKALKMQRERGNQFMAARANETAPMAAVESEPIGIGKNENDDIDALAKSIAGAVLGEK